MDKDRVKGKIKDIAGGVERKAGELTGDTEAQVKGTAKQAEGKVQNAWGKVKDETKKPKTASERAESLDPDEVEKEESDALRRRAG